jgi:hypothetical protein
MSHYYVNDFTRHYSIINGDGYKVELSLKYPRIFGDGHFIYGGGCKITALQNGFTKTVKKITYFQRQTS